MTATQGDLADLSRFIFRAPRWYASLGFALALAAITGLAAFDTQYALGDMWEGVFFVGIPTVVAAFGTTGVDRWVGGRLTPNRSSLLALACEVLIVLLLALAGLGVAVAGPLGLPALGQNFVFDVLLFGLAAVFAVRLLVILAVSRRSVPVAAIPASLQTATAAVLLFVYSGTMRYLELGGGPLADAFLSRPEKAPPELLVVAPADFVHLGLLCLLHGAAVVAFVHAVDRPWRNSLGVSPLDFLAGFVGHVAEDSDELEGFFERIGEEAEVPVTVLAFRERDGARAEIARFVLPMIHPGPMGTIGGGDLPERVAASADGLGVPPHATAGHDFNLVTEGEIDRLLDAADRAHDRIEYVDTATVGVRSTTGEATVTGQGFGDGLLLAATFSPGCADDVDFGVGLAARSEARIDEFEDACLIDAHNCNDGLDGDDLGHVTPGSERSFDLIGGARDAALRAAAAHRGDLAVGTAWDETPWDPLDGIGPLGVRCIVTDVDGDTTAWVCVDGNNMEPGVRDRIVDAIDRVDRIEVFTSDTHVVNRVDAVNQVGEAIPLDELVSVIDDCVDRALDGRTPATAGMATERVAVTVFGNDRTETLASHANAAVSMGGAVAAAIVLAVASLSGLIFLFA